MIPERFQDYFFNDRDYLPETYEVEDKEREKLIRQLAALITDDLGMAGKPNKISNDEPDFWLLDKLLTTEEVKFMLNFKKKRTVKLNAVELAKRNKMSVEEATEMAEGICSKLHPDDVYRVKGTEYEHFRCELVVAPNARKI